MPKLPINYSNTIIYKIVCNDLEKTEVYVGHTTDFTKRKNCHKIACHNLNSKKYNFKLYKYIRENGGWENFSMVEVEKYPCSDGNEARTREREWYEKLNSNLNTRLPALTDYEKENYKKIYFDNHKEQKKEYDKIYFQENKEKKYEYAKHKYNCICGSVICQSVSSRHKNSIKHQNYLNLQNKNI